MHSKTAAVRLLAALVIGGLVMTGCGGGAPSTPAAGGQGGPSSAGPGGGNGGPGATTTGGVPTDFCSLLTVDEVAGALSTDPVLTTGPNPFSNEGCLYLLAGYDRVLLVQVTTKAADAYFAELDETRESVDGVADAALYSTSARELTIKTSGVVVDLRAYYASDAGTTLTNLKALARIVVARLAGTPVPPDAVITAPPLVHVANACGLLTADDVARVLGTGTVTVVDGSGDQFCAYTLASTGEYLVGIYLDRKGGLAAWQELVAVGDTVPVDGLGDDAAWDAFRKRLNVQTGDQIMHVEVYSVADDKALAVDRQLMELMLGRI